MGLSLILAPLAVVGIVFLVMDIQVRERTEQVRNQGFGLVLGGMPWFDRVDSAPGQGVLRTLLCANTDSDFVYGAVVDAGGQTRGAVSAPGLGDAARCYPP